MSSNDDSRNKENRRDVRPGWADRANSRIAFVRALVVLIIIIVAAIAHFVR
jgi:hypothetical protein